MDKALFVQKLKAGYAKYEQFIKKFVYTDYYLLLITVISIIGWATKCAPVGVGILSVVAFLVLIGTDDALPLTANIFGAILVIYTNKIEEIIYIWPALLLLVPGFIVFFAKNSRHKFRLGKMFMPQAAVSVALLMGGVGVVATADYARSLPNILLLGIGVLAIYVFYNHYLKRDVEHHIPTYFSKVMMYLGIIICAELLIEILRSGVPVSQWHTTYWDVGWGNRNNISTWLIITAGLTMYLSTKEKFGWIYFIVALIQYVCIVLSFSRGGIIFGAVSGVLALIFAVIKAPNRKRALISVGIIAALAIILYLIFMDKINAIIGSLLERGMGTSGRTDLYLEAWQRFKEHPLFGVGLGYVGNNFDINIMSMYWFHSTLFQVIGSMGLIGLAAYVYFYAVRAKLLFRRIKNTFNLFVLATWIGFEGYCMIDAGTFVPYPNMMLILVMSLLLELNTDCKPTDLYRLTYEPVKPSSVAQCENSVEPCDSPVGEQCNGTIEQCEEVIQ